MPAVEAVVTVGEVTFTDEQGQYDNDNPGIFTHYMIYNRYESDRHIYMMGISSPEGFQGNSVAFVKLTAPTLLWVCDWTASKIGGKPKIPNPVVQDQNWVLLDVLPETAMENVGSDGVSRVYRISGTYVYGHKNPNADVFRNIGFPRPPYLLESGDRDMDASNLEQGLILPQQGGGGGGGGATGTPIPPQSF